MLPGLLDGDPEQLDPALENDSFLVNLNGIRIAGFEVIAERNFVLNRLEYLGLRYNGFQLMISILSFRHLGNPVSAESFAGVGRPDFTARLYWCEKIPISRSRFRWVTTPEPGLRFALWKPPK